MSRVRFKKRYPFAKAHRWTRKRDGATYFEIIRGLNEYEPYAVGRTERIAWREAWKRSEVED